MSYDYREDGAYDAHGDGMVGGAGHARKGSVKAARERLQVSQRAQMQGIITTNQARLGLPSKPNQLVSQFSMPGSQESLGRPSTNGSTRNAPTPQWPLLDDDSDDSPSERARPRLQPSERNIPPARPARPDLAPPPYEPTTPEGSLPLPIQSNNYPAARAASLSPKDAWQDERGYLSPSFGEPSPNPSRPITTSSQASTTSSLGSIPDFPVPVLQQSKRSPIGLPPSARRGPSSYYSSHLSYVSPIVEESEGTRSHNSFASSNVIPNDPAGFYFDDEITPSDEEPPVRSERSSRAENYDEQSNLVRKASLGRRTKPSLTTIKSGDSLRVPNDRSPPQGSPRPQLNQLGSGTVLLDPSSSSDESVSVGRKGRTGYMENAAKTDSITLPVSAFEEETTPEPPEPAKVVPQRGLSQRVGARRPPRLNVGAVRDAEARGSLTSLPDLIRRATRLAANLDRGKTASRLGLEFFDGGEFKDRGEYDNRRSGSLSDMLASFPPPGVATPLAEKSPANMSGWPSGQLLAGDSSQGRGRQAGDKNRRRCCGLPFWGFITLIIVLFLLIAAAVIIPIVLIVLPRQNNSTSGAAPSKQVQCTNNLKCQNGGVLIPANDGSCQCLCTNGFTGSTCTTASDPGCITNRVSDIQNATLGSAIPRLLQQASKFNVPLDSSLLLSEFSSADLSCTAENALVTFNGLSSREVIDLNIPLLDLEPSISEIAVPLITAAPLAVRAAPPDPVSTNDVITSNGILIQGTPTSGVPAATATPAPSGSASPAPSVASNSTILDFARVSVLYILQVARQLDPAVTAQERLQTFLQSSTSTKGSDARNVTLGNGFFVDLTDMRLALSNGTIVGVGTGPS